MTAADAPTPCPCCSGVVMDLADRSDERWHHYYCKACVDGGVRGWYRRADRDTALEREEFGSSCARHPPPWEKP